MQNEAVKEKKTFGRSVLICVLCSIVMSACLVALNVFVMWYSVSENGSTEPSWNLFGLTLLAAIISVLVVLVAMLLLCFERTQRTAVCLLIVSLIYLVTFSICPRIGQKVYMHGFVKLAERSKPLIESIKLYEKDHGQAPASMEDLVPDYLDEVPSTGIGDAESGYMYNRSGGEDVVINWGNPWQLVVDTPCFGLGWDMFIYVPKQNYPDSVSYERIGDWVYLHE